MWRCCTTLGSYFPIPGLDWWGGLLLVAEHRVRCIRRAWPGHGVLGDVLALGCHQRPWSLMQHIDFVLRHVCRALHGVAELVDDSHSTFSLITYGVMPMAAVA